MRRQIKEARAAYRKLMRRGCYARALYLKKWIKTHSELLRG